MRQSAVRTHNADDILRRLIRYMFVNQGPDQNMMASPCVRSVIHLHERHSRSREETRVKYSVRKLENLPGVEDRTSFVAEG